MNQKEKLAELSSRLDKLKENASALSEAEFEKQLKEIKLEMSQMKADEITTRLDNIEDNMKKKADDSFLNQITVDQDSKVGTKSSGSRSHGVY